MPTVLRDLRIRLSAAEAAGVEHDRIAVDAGFGFGKRGAENWTLLARLQRLHELGWPLIVGLSRKGFLSNLPADRRDPETHAASIAAAFAGAHILRVHDVRGAARAAAVADQIMVNAELATR